MPDFDLVVIGAGAAGLSVAAGAAQLGVRTALVERDRMGGDCLNFGCVPSKALLAAAHTARAIRESGRFGLRASPPGVDWPGVDWDAVREHVHEVIAAIAPNDSEARFTGLGVTVLRGEARFTGPDSVSVTPTKPLAGSLPGSPEERTLTAKRFVIATGSRAVVPPIPGLADIPHWTNAEIFALAERPEHLLILGGGPIGLEMADAFSGLGCRVTVIEAASIANRDDHELVAGLRLALTRRGVTILEGTAVASVLEGRMAAPALESTPASPAGEAGIASRAKAGPVLVLADGRRVAGSHLLVAVGRRPNLEHLIPEAAGIAVSRLGIVTDSGLRCPGNKRVYAAGDIADPVGLGPRAFTHVGLYHAGVIIRRALFRLPAKLDYRALPRVTYTHPELAQVGMTEAEARAAGHKISVLRWPLSENDRAVAERDEEGLVKLVVSGNRVLGAGILAPHAGEMIGQWTLAIAEKTSLSALAGLIVPYPTRSEAGKRAIGTYFMPKLFAPRTKALVRWLGWLP